MGGSLQMEFKVLIINHHNHQPLIKTPQTSVHYSSSPATTLASTPIIFDAVILSFVHLFLLLTFYNTSHGATASFSGNKSRQLRKLLWQHSTIFVHLFLLLQHSGNNHLSPQALNTSTTTSTVEHFNDHLPHYRNRVLLESVLKYRKLGFLGGRSLSPSPSPPSLSQPLSSHISTTNATIHSSVQISLPPSPCSENPSLTLR
ncbi:hypothetical protein PIB30_024383 [Stylosanthes scabra]|uniref:Uncharacterized protein n=1 Tax=Stylosanthes scabra TaxID=79078 RepID=A0ABU6SA88_9FABA|nr:hypothetical protein [Stylosanthes scabra]